MATRKNKPSRNMPAPAPTVGAMYCHTCGRIITPRKSHLKSLNTPTPPKYCSDRCRREKPPAHNQGLESEIEKAFVEMLGVGEHAANRQVVLCGEVEAKVFGNPPLSTVSGEGETTEEGEEESSDETSDEDGGVPLSEHLLPTSSPKTQPKAAGDLTPQQLGRQRAANREKVRQAARRGAVFGFPVDGGLQNIESDRQKSLRRKVEAIQGGRVVDASFAKGEWGVRWKDEQA